MAGNATGALRTAARRVGASLAEYELRVARGEKWCTACKVWHPVEAFGVDLSRGDGRHPMCLDARRCRYIATYVRIPPDLRRRPGPPPSPARDGDKLQARSRVNHHVTRGRWPDPNDLPCVDCGHVWAEGERRHEYHHHLGYGAEHHENVVALCSRCHHAREARR